MERKIQYQPVGVIHTPFSKLEGMPIQPAGAKGVKGTVEVFEAFREGLKDLDGFSHVILLYHFHRASSAELIVVPFMDTVPRGVFATRAPRRPNAIGMSVMVLRKIENGVLHIENVDILDGTPLLDIKPCVPDFEPTEKFRTGWLSRSGKSVKNHRSDDRFR